MIVKLCSRKQESCVVLEFGHGCRIDPFPRKEVLPKCSVSFMQRAMFVPLMQVVHHFQHVDTL